MKFKIGDYVQLMRDTNNAEFHQLREGYVGVIKKIESDCAYVYDDEGRCSCINFNGLNRLDEIQVTIR